MQVTINFGGFYDSIHSDNIDGKIEYLAEDYKEDDKLFDYDIEISHSVSSQVYDVTDDWVRDIIEYDSDYLPYKGLFLANIDKVRNKVEKMIDTLQDEVEAVFEDCSTPLNKVAQFSNGEAMYEIAQGA